ncbi:hypothetical protein DYB30_003951 [Aphanomyces astaci]|uniref:Uncharacterized protein n=1 Tax=Aphanomyces astaci TaxID=112090 RepID=A0A397EQA5_APHAT|nr:hypothetical protein DYB34_006554 [Aphanomyces astaci]RHY77951.1 hypothetical protein DYB30_003951 [Aphanomyces astaci]RHZ01523.1 hypothetical protein DYB31_000088 [Aphanomyces astaci]
MAASAGKPKWKYIVALGRTDFLQTAQPHANEAIWTREVSRQLENHLTRINHAQPSIDTSVPKTAANVSTGSKKNQLKEDRLDAIEIENRRLLDRIASIALSTTKDSVDAPSNHPTVKKSLHEGQRKREQQKIWLENQKLKFVKSKEHKLTAQDTIDHQHDSTADDDHAAKTAKPRHCKKGGKPSNKVFIDVSTYRPHSVTDVTAPTFVNLPPLQCDPPVTNDITSNDRPVPQPTDDELLPTSQPHNGAAYTLPSIVLTKDGVSSAPGSSPAPWSPLSAIDSPPVPPMSSYNDDESDAALLLPLVSTDPKEDWVTVVTTSAPMGYSREGSAAEYLLEQAPSVEAQPLLSQETALEPRIQQASDVTTDTTASRLITPQPSREPDHDLGTDDTNATQHGSNAHQLDNPFGPDPEDPSCQANSSTESTRHPSQDAVASDDLHGNQVDAMVEGIASHPSPASNAEDTSNISSRERVVSADAVGYVDSARNDNVPLNPTAFLMRCDSLTSGHFLTPRHPSFESTSPTSFTSSPAEYFASHQADNLKREDPVYPDLETAPKDNDGHDYYDEFEEDAHEAEPPVAMIAAEVADVRGCDLPVDLLADNGTSTATAASTVTPLDSKAELDVKFERIHATAIAIVTAATDEAVKTKSVHKAKATQHQHALDHTIVSTNHHDIEAQPAVDCTDETSIGDGLATTNTEQLLPAAFDPSSNQVHATYSAEGAKVAGVSTIGTTNQDGPTTDENVTRDYADIKGDGGSRIHDSNDTQSMGGGVSFVNSTDETTYEQCPPINVDNSSRNLDGRSMPLPTAFLMHCDSLTRGYIANHEPLENALDSSPSTSPAEYFSGHDDDGFEPESPPAKPPSPLSFRHDVTDDEQDYNDEFEEDAAKASDEAPVPPSEPGLGDIATSWVLEESANKHEYYDDDFDNN